MSEFICAPAVRTVVRDGVSLGLRVPMILPPRGMKLAVAPVSIRAVTSIPSTLITSVMVPAACSSPR